MSSVREAVWNGKIALEIHLDDPDCLLSCLQAAQLPLYLLEARLSYLPLLIPQIRRHFGSFVQQPIRHGFSEFDDFEEERLSSQSTRSRSTSSFSISSNLDGFFTAVFGEERIALPWHLPIGLLFDLNCIFLPQLMSRQLALPFKVTFHLSANVHLFSQEQFAILTLPAQLPLEEALTSVYFSALKESDYVRCGSSKNVMNLARADQMQLWESLKLGQFERFWRTNAKLTGFEGKAAPIKLWIMPEDGKLKRFALSSRLTESLTVSEWLNTEFTENFAVLCHGIFVPASTRMLDLVANFCYADNFLHLILIKQQS